MGRRIRWLALILVVCFAAVLAQLVNIQLRQATSLDASKQNPRNSTTQFDNRRGVILASDGTVLAKSVPVASPNSSQPYKFRREYTTGPLYSGIVGYSSPAYFGTSGVEYTYNTYLGLHHQKAQTLGQLLNPPGTTTDSVQLTVIPSLQKAAQQALSSVPDTNKDGAVVVLGVKTASVLAMYSSPTYTNNALATPTPKKDQAAGQADTHTPDHEGFFAYPPMATADAFAPGSTFKVVTSTAVYQLKPALDNFSFKVAGCTPKPGSPGAIPQTNKRICNESTTPTAAVPCGGTMLQMLPESCDPGYAELGLAVGGVDLSKEAGLFGYNQTPPIDIAFPPGGVAKSYFPPASQLAPTGKLGLPGVALSAFGQQTVTTTALQNAMVAEGVADGGSVMTPHVMADIRDATGAIVKKYTPTVYKRAATPAAAKHVNELMQLVPRTPRGTAYGDGFPSSWDIAVKTGTAQAGPNATNTTDWMIGFAPAYDPVVAVSVVVPLQARVASGASIAGPIMKAMMTAALKIVPHQTTPPGTTIPTNPPTTLPSATTSTTAPGAPPTTTTTPGTAPTTTTTAPPPATTTTAPVPATSTTLPSTATTAAYRPLRRRSGVARPRRTAGLSAMARRRGIGGALS